MSVALPVREKPTHVVPEYRSKKLEIKNISKAFTNRSGTLYALHDVSITVADGEFACIVGPSGCGKSTLFNIVAGLDIPDAGTVRVEGVPVSQPGPDRVVVFQSGALFPWLTVRANVEFGLKVQRIPARERRERAEEVLDMMRLGRFGDHRIHQLSGGMRQRVAIARALVLRPKLLMMDEPFAALDAQTRNVLHEELQSLRTKNRTTVLFVTHNVEEAAKLGDRVIVLSYRPGRVILDMKIQCDHPRQPHDTRLQEPIHRILRTLIREVEEATREEMGGRE